MADGPRYKMLGNSMAVPVMRWIGERIAMVDVMPLPHTSAPHAGADARREPSPTVAGVGNVSVNHVDHGI